jgi:hypothetical protein
MLENLGIEKFDGIAGFTGIAFFDAPAIFEVLGNGGSEPVFGCFAALLPGFRAGNRTRDLRITRKAFNIILWLITHYLS